MDDPLLMCFLKRLADLFNRKSRGRRLRAERGDEGLRLMPSSSSMT
jgi:hypothetical protein